MAKRKMGSSLFRFCFVLTLSHGRLSPPRKWHWNIIKYVALLMSCCIFRPWLMRIKTIDAIAGTLGFSVVGS